MKKPVSNTWFSLLSIFFLSGQTGNQLTHAQETEGVTEEQTYRQYMMENEEGGTLSQINRKVFDLLDEEIYEFGKLSDCLQLLAFFCLGCLLTAYFCMDKDKSHLELSQLVSKIQGQKGEYERARKTMMAHEAWVHRFKTIERLFYIFVVTLSLCMYQFRDLFNFLINDNAIITIPLILITILFLRVIVGFQEQKFARSSQQLEDMKSNEDDHKRALVSKLDPVIVDTLREVIMDEKQQEIQEMRNSDLGCSQKCTLIKTIAEKNLSRHQAVVNKLFDFEWCDVCSGSADPSEMAPASNGDKNRGPLASSMYVYGDKKHGAHICKAGCGPKFVKLCMPQIILFGKKEAEIKSLQEQLVLVEQQIQELKEIAQAKKNLQKLKEQAKQKLHLNKTSAAANGGMLSKLMKASLFNIGSSKTAINDDNQEINADQVNDE